MRFLFTTLASLLALAPVSAQAFEPGLYTSRNEDGSIRCQLLFSMKEGSSDYRVTGDYGGDPLATQVVGRYDPVKNLLDASTFMPRAGGVGAQLAMLAIGGHWDPISRVFTVTPAGLPSEILTRDVSGPKPREPWIQITVDPPSPQQRGALARARVGISVRNVFAPFELDVGACLQRRGWGGPDLVCADWITLPIEDDDEHEFELSDLFGLTIPCEVQGVVLLINTSRASGDDEVRIALDLTELSTAARPVDVHSYLTPYSPISGEPANLLLQFKLNAPNTLDHFVRTQVTIEPFGNPGAAIPLPDHNFLAHGSPTGSRGPDQEWDFVAPPPGRYRLRYTIEGDDVTPYVNASFFNTVAPKGSSGPSPGAKPSDAKAKLTGDIVVSHSVVKVGESNPTTFTLAKSGAGDDREVDTVVRIRGPKGDVVAERIKRYTMEKDLQWKGVHDLRFQSPGEYTIELLATGDRVEPLRREAKIKVEEKPAAEPAPAGSTETGATTGAQGTYGLISKTVGKAAPALSGREGTWSGSITETTLNATYVLKPPGQGQINVVLTWPEPPATLKPGEILELTCQASATASGTGLPYIGDSATWGASGSCEMLERKNAFAGYSGQDGKLYPSGEAKCRIKIDPGGGRIQLHTGHPSIVWGEGGEWTPCVYTYEWNKPPITTAPKPTGGETTQPQDEGPGAATITAVPPDDDEDEKRIRAHIEPREVVLFAGAPSQIVDVHISGYRRDTEDRVEVVFPQKTDNWASLPGQIVVGGGNGSYWPPNMATPEHVDAYFFSARQTARGGTFTVWWIVRQKGAGAVRLPLTVRVVPRPGRQVRPGGPARPDGVTSADGGQRVSPLGAASSFAGKWTSDIGPVVFTVKGNQVTGIASDIVPIDGTIEGTKLKFSFPNTPDRIGELDLAADGQSWKGFYWEPDSTRGPFRVHIKGRRAAR